MKKIKLLVLICLASLFVGCGSASNNDQGVSFTLLGFFADNKGETGLVGIPMSLSEMTGSEPSSPGKDNLLISLGLLNGLTGQYIRLQRLYISYDIPGASVAAPSTTFPLAVVIAPSGVSGSGVKTSLPTAISGATGAGNPTYLEFSLVPAAIKQWLNFNRMYLPEAPFVIEATVVASGVTSAGDQLDSNPGTIMIYVSPDGQVG